MYVHKPLCQSLRAALNPIVFCPCDLQKTARDNCCACLVAIAQWQEMAGPAMAGFRHKGRFEELFTGGVCVCVHSASQNTSQGDAIRHSNASGTPSLAVYSAKSQKGPDYTEFRRIPPARGGIPRVLRKGRSAQPSFGVCVRLGHHRVYVRIGSELVSTDA